MILNYKKARLNWICGLMMLFYGLGTATAQQVYSEHKYPITDFRQPLGIAPPALSGSFGELRSNHFHSGMDFRTNQREGYPVYAVSDGYVSRLRVQNSGFGLALYIDHPNGFSTVYGHLQRFSPKLEAYVKQNSYAKKSFEVDLFPEAKDFLVRKGEVIGWSGNRGSSGGPHLHFEVRDTKTEETINPYLLGVNVPDHVKPVVSGLYLYQLDGQAFSEAITKRAIPFTGGNGVYKVNVPIVAGGEIGLGLVTNDRHDGASGLNGVYSIVLSLDGEKIYTSALERFRFDHSRGINAHIDYPMFINTRRSIQKSFKSPGNPIAIYHHLINEGRIQVEEGKLYDLKYEITDASGNTSRLDFQLQGIKSTPKAAVNQNPYFAYAQDNQFKNEFISVEIPKGNLYDDLFFQYKKSNKPTVNAYSDIHHIHLKTTPIHQSYVLKIKADLLPEHLRSKALIVSDQRGSQGGSYVEGYVQANLRSFGNFFISVDTIAPSISPVNIQNNKNMRGISKMIFKIRDNLSGIKSFNGYLNGKWILFEFDAKTATLWHTFDELTRPGKNTVELIVEDMKENSNRISLDFIR